MGHKLIKLGDAEKYLLDEYGLRWSRPTWRKLIREHKLEGGQLHGRGWWYTTRESIDALMRDFRVT